MPSIESEPLRQEGLADQNIRRVSYPEFIDNLRHRFETLLCPTGEAYLHSPQKRIFDIVGSTVLLPLASIPVFGAAACIKLEDGGPILFIADVAGQYGENYGMIKLRSMVRDAQEYEHTMGLESVRKDQNDPRITKVSRIIRRLTVDELPQLINVLRGDMSLVGNRPMFQGRMDQLKNLSSLSDDVYPNWVRAYVLAKPGMAGLATSRGRGLLDQTEQGVRNRLRYDEFYIMHASLGFDIKIIWDTIKAVISRTGAF